MALASRALIPVHIILAAQTLAIVPIHWSVHFLIRSHLLLHVLVLVLHGFAEHGAALIEVVVVLVLVAHNWMSETIDLVIV